MRTLIVLALLAVAAVPAFASRRVTVEQLERAIAEASSKNRSDQSLVRMLAELTLSERLSEADRERIAKSDHLGPQATLALQLLADESAVLDPPDLPKTPAPDDTTAQRILNAARTYVSRTLPQLPDFFATRTTYSFDNSPQVLKENEWPVPAGLHLIGKSSREVTFRDAHELKAPTAKVAKAPDPIPPAQHGLETWGEFGKVLAVILLDTEKGTMSFHHWEQAPGGLIAVYRYSVPRTASNYSVDYCCISDGPRGSSRTGRGRRGGSAQSGPPPDATTIFHKTPAYHGSLFIDPATGVVLRITLEAELDNSPLARIATVIEYGPVLIGDRKFICPLRSMALTQSPAEPDPANPLFTAPPFTQVNESSFTNYHRLGSEIHILTDPAPPPAPRP